MAGKLVLDTIAAPDNTVEFRVRAVGKGDGSLVVRARRAVLCACLAVACAGVWAGGGRLWGAVLVLLVGVWLLLGRVRGAAALLESVLVIPGVGVQLRRVRADGGVWSRFVEAAQVQDVVVHEAIRTFDVVPYLALVLNDRRDVVVAFEQTLPPLEVLVPVLRGLRDRLAL